MVTAPASRSTRVGDWVEVHGIKGYSVRRGRIVELLGRGRHERYRVRWDEQHESIVYPTDGVMIVPRDQALGIRASSAPAGQSAPTT